MNMYKYSSGYRTA